MPRILLRSHLKLLIGVRSGNQKPLNWFFWTRGKLQMASIQRPPLIMGRARMVQNCVLGVFILIALIATQPASAGRSLLESEDSAKTHHLYWTVINDIGLKISPGPSWLQFLSTDPFFFFPLFLFSAFCFLFFLNKRAWCSWEELDCQRSVFMNLQTQRNNK